MGPTHSDSELWELVSLIKAMPDLSESQFIALSSSVQDDGHDHEHGNTGGMVSHGTPVTAQPDLSGREENHVDFGSVKDTMTQDTGSMPQEIKDMSKPPVSPVDDHYSDGHTH